jgi:hypothetical protein
MSLQEWCLTSHAGFAEHNIGAQIRMARMVIAEITTSFWLLLFCGKDPNP